MRISSDLSVSVYIGIGGNLEHSEDAILNALAKFKAKALLISVSSLYISAPQDYLEQNNFLNCVAKIGWQESAENLLEYLQQLELEAGRNRFKQIAKGPRILDLDILLFGEQSITKKELTIPHAQMLKRRFVLEPLVELEKELTHPLTGLNFQLYLNDCLSQAIYSKQSILVH